MLGSLFRENVKEKLINSNEKCKTKIRRQESQAGFKLNKIESNLSNS